MAAQMDVHRRVPFFQRGGNEHAVAHDPGVVHHHVKIAKRSNRSIDDALGGVPIGDVLVIGDRVAACRLDLGNHCVCRAGIAPFAVQRGADVVDHHVRAFGAESQRIGPAQPARRAGDDDGASVTDPIVLSPVSIKGIAACAQLSPTRSVLGIFALGEGQPSITANRSWYRPLATIWQRIAGRGLDDRPLRLAGCILAICGQRR
jgi:hypothetical protein